MTFATLLDEVELGGKAEPVGNGVAVERKASASKAESTCQQMLAAQQKPGAGCRRMQQVQDSDARPVSNVKPRGTVLASFFFHLSLPLTLILHDIPPSTLLLSVFFSPSFFDSPRIHVDENKV